MQSLVAAPPPRSARSTGLAASETARKGTVLDRKAVEARQKGSALQLTVAPLALGALPGQDVAVDLVDHPGVKAGPGERDLWQTDDKERHCLRHNSSGSTREDSALQLTSTLVVLSSLKKKKKKNAAAAAVGLPSCSPSVPLLPVSSPSPPLLPSSSLLSSSSSLLLSSLSLSSTTDRCTPTEPPLLLAVPGRPARNPLAEEPRQGVFWFCFFSRLDRARTGPVYSCSTQRDRIA
eukprot:SAG22_NODE_1728_length_3710_cov_1.760731_4_plen_235_part_00